ncbi:PTS glucitol/sorbitol transporter subunit IIC, partial [Escherichia coli]
ELFGWLGVAAGIQALGLPVTSLALRYIAAAMVIGLIRGIITEYLFLRLSKQGNEP